MARNPRITYEEVVRAAYKLLQKGQNPTHDAIHQLLGNRGSRSTVHKFKKQWLEKLGDEDAVNLLPATVPKELMPMVDELWGLAVDQAGRAHAEDKSALEAMASQAKQAQIEAETELAEVRQQLQEARHALDRQEDRCITLTDKAASLERLEADLRHQLQSANDRVEDLTRAREQDRLQYDQLLANERSEHRRQLEHLQQQVADLTAQKELEIQRSDKDIAYFQNQLALERDATTAAKQEHANDRVFLQRQLEAKSQQYAKMEARYDDQVLAFEKAQKAWEDERESLAEQVRLAEDKVYQLAEDRAALTSQVAQLKESLESLTQSVKDSQQAQEK